MWTTDEEDQVRALWAQKNTAAQIAKIMGRTRNSVIGKIHRLNCPKRKNPIPKKYNQRAVIKKMHTAHGEQKLLVDLRSCECHFPVTHEPPYMFCGGQSVRPGGYCQHHHAISYLRSRPVIKPREKV